MDGNIRFLHLGSPQAGSSPIRSYGTPMKLVGHAVLLLLFFVVSLKLNSQDAEVPAWAESQERYEHAPTAGTPANSGGVSALIDALQSPPIEPVILGQPVSVAEPAADSVSVTVSGADVQTE
jgi:hypothetical protein